jgi:aminoglycoside phosphotransferase family enzyme
MDSVQDEVIEFLSKPASYGVENVEVSRIETHCSIVFLVGARAYKLKRAIAFSMLDYSTLERREAACRAELALNRRTAPQLYLGVQAIRRRADGGLGLDGDGAIVDWIVVMRRFEQSDMLDRLADTGGLTEAIIRALADEITRFHAAAEIAPGYGGAAGLRAAIDGNHRDQLTVAPLLRKGEIDALQTDSIAALDRVAALLDRRRAAGKVRRCHGDLRLANIFLLDGKPTLFDAIEFSDSLSCIDVLYDLAFLLVDLDQRGLNDLANLAFNRYLDDAAETDGLEALPLMLSIRAAIRAYALASGSQRRPRGEEKSRFAATARRLLTRSRSLLPLVPASLCAIGGGEADERAALACGLAADFAPLPGARLLHLKAPSDNVAEEALQVLRAGYSVVVEADFREREQRAAARAIADRAPAVFLGLWLGGAEQTPHDTLASPDWHVLATGRGPAAVLATAKRMRERLPR